MSHEPGITKSELVDATGEPLGTSGNPLVVDVTATVASTVAQGNAGTAAQAWWVKPTADGVTASLPLPSGAATEASLSSIDGKLPAIGPQLSAQSLSVTFATDVPPLTVNIGSTVDRTATGTLTATETVDLATEGCGTASLQVSGIWTGTIYFEFTVDSSTWRALYAEPNGGGTLVSSTTSSGTWVAEVASYASVRFRGGVVTGSAAVIVNASTASTTVALGAPLPPGTAHIGEVSVSSSALPSNAAQETGGHLASIDSHLPAQGQALMAASLPVVIASDQSAIAVTGSVSPNNSVSAANSSTTPLTGGASFTGTGVEVLNYAAVEVFAYANVAGTLYLEFSTDNADWDLSIPYSLTVSNPHLDVPSGPHARYFRVRYVNGGSAQATFRLQTLLLASTPAPHTIPLSSVPAAGDDAVLVQAEIVGATTAGGGAYVPVKVAPSGAVQVGGGVAVYDSTNTNAASVINSAPSTEYGLVVRNVPSGTQPVSGTVTANAGSGSFTVAGVAANGVAASGNPVLVAGTDGTNSRTLRTDTTGRPPGSAITFIGSATTTTIKSSAGILRRVVVGYTAGAVSLAIYDNNGVASNQKAGLTMAGSASGNPVTVEFNAEFSTGITVVSTGTTVAVSVVYD